MPVFDQFPDFTTFSLQCAPTVHVKAMEALVHVESSNRQFAIAVVDGPQVRQPRTLKEAVTTVEMLDQKGYNYSVGYAQVNKQNFSKYGLTPKNAFDACANLRAGSKILEGCFVLAAKKYPGEQQRLRAAYSCYYSGNFLRGFRPDKSGQLSYVDKIIKQALGTIDSVSNRPRFVRGLGSAWQASALSH